MGSVLAFSVYDALSAFAMTLKFAVLLVVQDF